MNGTDEQYSNPAKTDYEAVKRILEWNKNYFMVDPTFEKHIPPYKKIVSVITSEMFESGLTRHSTSRSIILTSELRAIGLPVMSTFSISCECNPNDDENCNNKGTHPQNLVYIGGKEGNWVLVDYNYGFNVRKDPLEYSVMTAMERDFSEIDSSYWIYILDTPRIHWPFDLVYYTHEKNLW